MSNQPICDFLKLNKMVFLSFIILCIIPNEKKRLKWRDIIMFEAL